MAVRPYTARGTRLYIGPAVATVPANAAAYAALTWTEVRNVRTFSPFGEVRPVISRVVVGREYPVKKVGPADPGDLAVMIYPDDGDAGQIALASAARTRSKYAVKIGYPIGSRITPSASISLRYFSALVTANANQLGSADDIATEQFNLAVVSQIIRVASVTPPVVYVNAALALNALMLTSTAKVLAKGNLAVTLGSLTSFGALNNAIVVDGDMLSVDDKVLTL